MTAQRCAAEKSCSVGPAKRVFYGLFWPTVGAVLLLVAVMIAGVTYFKSFDALFAFLRGEPLSCENRRVDLGRIRAGEKTTVRYHLRNITTQSVKIIGVESSCSCVAAKKEEFPIGLAPGQARDLTVRVNAPSQPGQFDRSLRVFLDGGQSELVLSFCGEVTDGQGDEMKTTNSESSSNESSPE